MMGANLRTKDSIIHGESEGKSFYEIIEASHTFGWRNFDQACLEAYEQNFITEESALLYCTKRGVVSRNIDKVKKARGEVPVLSDLQMRRDSSIPRKSGSPSLPAAFKLKT
jgi:twitching motility protein PilT